MSAVGVKQLQGSVGKGTYDSGGIAASVYSLYPIRLEYIRTNRLKCFPWKSKLL